MKKTAILIYDSFVILKSAPYLRYWHLPKNRLRFLELQERQSEVKMGCRYYLMILSII